MQTNKHNDSSSLKVQTCWSNLHYYFFFFLLHYPCYFCLLMVPAVFWGLRIAFDSKLYLGLPRSRVGVQSALLWTCGLWSPRCHCPAPLARPAAQSTGLWLQQEGQLRFYMKTKATPYRKTTFWHISSLYFLITFSINSQWLMLSYCLEMKLSRGGMFLIQCCFLGEVQGWASRGRGSLLSHEWQVKC